MRPNPKSEIIDLNRWNADLPQLTQRYSEGIPYPNIVLDDFMNKSAANAVLGEFPKVKGKGWIHYVHVNEKKHGLNKKDLLPPYIGKVVDSFNSPEFVNWLSTLTGINGLLADEMMEGGGLHQTLRGGFLNIHADFTVHPHKRSWRRRVNLLVYFNKDWEEGYGGDLELWRRDMKQCEQKIRPLFNRCVIFNTDEDSFHGLPDPLNCPEDMSRKSIALYYFTEEKERPRKRTTNYRARPGDGFRSILIWADKKLVAMYSVLKSKLGINDDLVSRILNLFGKNRKS